MIESWSLQIKCLNYFSLGNKKDMHKKMKNIIAIFVLLILGSHTEMPFMAGSIRDAEGNSGSEHIFFDGVDNASIPVMEKARQDIEKIRKGDFAIQFADEKDLPVSGKAEIKLVHHEFQFGANLVPVAFRKDKMLRNKALSIIDELFSTVRVGNRWRDVGQTKGATPDWEFTDSLIKWSQEHGKQMRFHCLIFNSPAAMPDWSQDIKTEKEWWPLIEDRIETVARKYGKVIDEYDVINEVISGSGWAHKQNPNFPDLVEPANAKRVFEIARKYLPEAKLVVLDYILAKETNRLFGSLYKYYENLLNIKTPINVIGYQGHYNSDGITPFHKGHRHLGSDAFTMKSINEEFENLARLGKPVHITEFNAPSRKKKFGPSQPFLTDKEIAAWEVNYYTLAFSKPYIHQLVRWHIIDGWTHGMDAGFLKPDGTIKPNYDAIKNLLKKTWATNWQGELEDGKVSFRGFYGKYHAKVQGYKSVEFVLNSKGKKQKKVLLVKE